MRRAAFVVTALAIAVLAPALAPGQEARMADLLAARAERPHAAGAPSPPAALVPPGVVLFSANAVNHVDVVRPLPDVTGDGLDEVIFGVRVSNQPNVFLLDGASSGTATEVWSFMTTGGLSNGYLNGDQCIVPSSDSDDNTYPNFLLGTAAGGRVAYAFDGLVPTELWRFDTYTQPDSGWVYSLAEMSDTTGDTVPEVAFGAGSDADSLWMVDGASSGTAAVLWTWSAPDAVISVRNLGDVNGDGDDDVLAAVGDNGERVVALDGSPPGGSGVVLWTYSTSPANVWSLNVVPDLTGDGVREALAAIWTSTGGAVRCINGATGAQVWASTTVAEYAMAVEPIADVTGDGVGDVVVGSWENAVQVLDGATGARVWKRAVGATNGGDVWTVRAVGDLNGDGYEDVVAGSFDTAVHVFSGLNGWRFWSYTFGRRVYNVHGLGDLTGDGVPEIAASLQNLAGASLPGVFVFDGDAGLDLPLFADDFENGEPVGWSATFADAPAAR